MSKNTDNPGLSPRRRKRPVENDVFAAFVGRVVRAHGRRVASGDVEALADLLALAGQLDAAIDHAVAGLRRHGYSWGEIASRIGVTRQAARQRWRDAA